jgi:UDPglucose 6-dehydrogenase
VQSEKLENIAVFGLGKLGACIAAILASRGFKVIGYDVDKRKTAALRKRLAPVEEPRLQETIESAGSRLTATDEVEEAIWQSDVSFYVPSTPSLPDGSFSNHFLTPALEAAALAVQRQQKKRHLFVVNSTVTPGTFDQVLRPLLERILAGECGRDFGLCYNPEFIALGDVIHGLLEPDFVLIGESDPMSGELLSGVYKQLNTNAAPIERMSNINAELAKISLNCAVTMKISFVNQLSGVCAKIPGADPAVILKAIGKDRRVGSDYLKPGLGFGGPCFPRDNRLFQYVAQSVGVEAALSRATDVINEDVNRRLLDTVLAHSSEDCSVGVLGLAYKPFTAVVDKAPGIWLCERLVEAKRHVLAHDFMAGLSAASALPKEHVRICATPAEIFQKGCRAIVITCPWPQYKLVFESNKHLLAGNQTAVIDPWRLLASIIAGEPSYIISLNSTASAVRPEVAAHA